VTEPTGPLVGQVALVSGAARGVGLACARRIAELGAHVVLTDVDVAAGAESARQVCADGLRASFATLDVSDVAAIRACVADVVSSHGRIDVLVNNAGIALVAEIEDVTEQLWDRTFQVNLIPVAYPEPNDCNANVTSAMPISVTSTTAIWPL
jgi:NAD(P)-dependent dehydrogenase (short-subunit alcohol dehydrogenase family)